MTAPAVGERPAPLDVTTLFREHASFVERALRRAGVAERDLADATQEVFVVAHRRGHEFEGRAHPRTWLYRIAWNVASETRRRAWRRHEVLAGVSAELGDGTHGREATSVSDEHAGHAPRDAFDEVWLSDARRALLDAIDRLDQEKRDALVLHDLGEEPMSTVAAKLRVPLKTAFSRVYAARRALRADLEKSGWCCSLAWLADWRSALRWKLKADALALAQVQASLVVSAIVAVLALAPAAPRQTTAPAALPREAHTATRSISSGCAAPTHTVVEEAVDVMFTEADALPSARDRARALKPRAPALASKRPQAHAASEPELLVFRLPESAPLGPFGESPLAHAETVAPEKHPHAQLPRIVAR